MCKIKVTNYTLRCELITHTRGTNGHPIFMFISAKVAFTPGMKLCYTYIPKNVPSLDIVTTLIQLQQSV